MKSEQGSSHRYLATLYKLYKSLSRVQLFVTPWTVARLAPLSMEFSMQEGSNPCSTLTPAKVSALPWVGSCDVPKETL